MTGMGMSQYRAALDILRGGGGGGSRRFKIGECEEVIRQVTKSVPHHTLKLAWASGSVGMASRRS